MTVDILGSSHDIAKAVKAKLTKQETPRIIDIRKDTRGFSILEDIKKGLRPAEGQEKTLPTLLLYDEEGLRLFEEITYLDEYYLTGAEIEVLNKYAGSIAERIQDGSIVLELGSGNLRKIKILLDALETAGKKVDYYALDLDRQELERTLSAVPEDSYKHVKCYGLNATYDDGLEWLKSDAVAGRPKVILTMGSSIGNFKREEAPGFLKSFADTLNIGDSILVGIDACKDHDKVYHAYNDKLGTTHRFILNGLKHANRLLGKDEFQLDQWSVIGEFDTTHGRHHAFVSPKVDVVIDGVRLKMGERIRIEESYKWSVDETARMMNGAGLVEATKWSNQTADYALHMAYKPQVYYPLKPELYAPGPVPTIDEWRQLWAAWDTVTLQMIPKDELLAKPIKLRNACIFYLGHIPTFLDIHLTNATKQPATEPADYPSIFERGIDPDVDNPELCHAHSEIPDEWPPLKEVLEFQGRVRDRVKSLYDNGSATSDHAIKKALWIGFEHEVLHLETLLYMLVQSEKTLPPAGAAIPDFAAQAAEAETNAVPERWFEIPARSLTVGINDVDDDAEAYRYFGWDNEKPERKVNAAGFEARPRPITNGEYMEYMLQSGITNVPSSWMQASAPNSSQVNGYATNGDTLSKAKAETNGTNGGTNEGVNRQGISTLTSSFLEGKSVRTVFGNVPLKYALTWPVMASYDELAGCAKWMGGRIPSAEEVRSLYDYVDEIRAIGGYEQRLGRKIPAVNGHLVNNGVQETPPSNPSVAVGGNAPTGAPADTTTTSQRSALFADLTTANTGFNHWHPTPVTHSVTAERPLGRAETGGAWEWTSTVLEPHDGFEAMKSYPGYTADFFDGKHNVVLGGSWATHPRVSGRKSFVNWYQRNYKYVWATARVVRDVQGVDANRDGGRAFVDGKSVLNGGGAVNGVA